MFDFDISSELLEKCSTKLQLESSSSQPADHEAFTHYSLAYTYHQQKKYELSLEHLFQAAQIPIENTDSEALKYIEAACLVLENYYFYVQNNPAKALAYYCKTILMGSPQILKSLFTKKNIFSKYKIAHPELLNFSLKLIFANEKVRTNIQTLQGSLTEDKSLAQSNAELLIKGPLTSNSFPTTAREAIVSLAWALTTISQLPPQAQETFISLIFEWMRLNILTSLDDELLTLFLVSIRKFSGATLLSNNHLRNLQFYAAWRNGDLQLAKTIFDTIDLGFTEIHFPSNSIFPHFGFKFFYKAKDYDNAFSYLEKIDNFTGYEEDLISFVKDLLYSNDLETIQLALKFTQQKITQLYSQQKAETENSKFELSKANATTLSQLKSISDLYNPVFIFKNITLYSIEGIQNKADQLIPQKLTLPMFNQKKSVSLLQNLAKFQKSIEKLSLLKNDLLLQPLYLPSSLNQYIIKIDKIFYTLLDYKTKLSDAKELFKWVQTCAHDVANNIANEVGRQADKKWLELAKDVQRILNDLDTIEGELIAKISVNDNKEMIDTNTIEASFIKMKMSGYQF